MSTEKKLTVSIQGLHFVLPTLSPIPPPSAQLQRPFILTPSSTPHRPLTRSQTGTVSKRRKRDDSEEVAATKKRTPPSRKKQKSVSASASGAEKSAPDNHPRRFAVSVSSGAGGMGSANAPKRPAAQFYHTSPTSEDQAQPECRLPRSRASLPTPIPNLTKKSRGRRKDHRLYVCTVTGCGKCFHRGEHLKRHIRSIHTHEKPFKCTFPLCQKFFNRHDNLLQHLKVHRDVLPTDAEGKSASALYAPSLHPTMSSYASTSETMSRITNMAVSSLRTSFPIRRASLAI
ncbi:hypothetical protein BJ912DRAFT_1022095 [Pholiota molesta]|nr:hypothetical protein BJ912DRAFT_1022095 [Pholiota molesta]